MNSKSWQQVAAVVVLCLLCGDAARSQPASYKRGSARGESRLAVATDGPDSPSSPAPAAPLPLESSAKASPLAEWSFRQADAHTCRGLDLGRRGAYFAGRAELIAALRFLAQGLDARGLEAGAPPAAHSVALDAALAALEEGDDLTARGWPSGPETDFSGLLSGHRTPVGQELQGKSWPVPQESLRRYLNFTEQRLGAAVGGEAAAAETLRGLARIHEILGQQRSAGAQLAEFKALIYYRVALSVVPRNPQIANDLGVLLARCGYVDEGRAALEHSLSLDHQPVVVHNLGVVYQQLGQPELAQRAYREAEAARGRADQSAGKLVRWVDPATMAQYAEVPVVQAALWASYAQGEYVEHARTAHVAQYRLRVDDQLDFVYRQTRTVTPKPYRLGVADEIRVQSLSKPQEVNADRVIVQPDGMITLRLIGEVPAAGLTISELRDELERQYTKYFATPAMTVVPLKMNAKVQDLIDAVDRRYGAGGGQARAAVVMPDGGLTLPEIGTLQAQGLSIPEMELEVNERYREKLEGLSITPILVRRAPRFVYVLGEVRNPGRFELEAPTTATQAVSLAGSWTVGANLRQIVLLRRGDEWQLMGCLLDLNDALYAKKPCPRCEIWLSDSDVLIVPKGNLLKADEFVSLLFTRGIYSVFPMSTVLNFNKQSTL